MYKKKMSEKQIRKLAEIIKPVIRCAERVYFGKQT